MADHTSPGDKTISRLMRRNDMGIQRKQGPDGGEVYSGPLARHALRTLGARAFTMDETIIVDEGFDFDKAEDAALYAHERVHVEGSGGRDMHVSNRDSEEVTARAVESMVLHRRSKGEATADIMRDAKKGGGAQALRSAIPDSPSSSPSGGSAPKGDTNPTGEPEDAAKTAMAALLASGKTQEQIVLELSRWVIEQMKHGDEVSQFRSSPARSFR